MSCRLCGSYHGGTDGNLNEIAEMAMFFDIAIFFCFLFLENYGMILGSLGENSFFFGFIC